MHLLIISKYHLLFPFHMCNSLSSCNASKISFLFCGYIILNMENFDGQVQSMPPLISLLIAPMSPLLPPPFEILSTLLWGTSSMIRTISSSRKYWQVRELVSFIVHGYKLAFLVKLKCRKQLMKIRSPDVHVNCIIDTL